MTSKRQIQPIPKRRLSVDGLSTLSPHTVTRIEDRMLQELRDSFLTEQTILLKIAHQLIQAETPESIYLAIIESFCTGLGFSIGQFIRTDAQTHTGKISIEYYAGDAKPVQYPKPKIIPAYTTLLAGLMPTSRTAQTFYPIHQSFEGHSLSTHFLLREQVTSGLMIPLFEPLADSSVMNMTGTLNFFNTENPQASSPDDLHANMREEVVKRVVPLISAALQRAKTLEKALALATTDELTGLTNRRGFNDRLGMEIERTRRTLSPLCVAMLDLDHFKHLNDAYGHLNGDRVLCAVADVLNRNIRKIDVLCRFGGEEFALLLPNTSLKSAHQIVERIRRKIERLNIEESPGEFMKITISAGIIQIEPGSLNKPLQEIAVQVLNAADAQLYQAKEQGRNRICTPV